MAEAPAFLHDGLPVQWNLPSRRSRKPGCSNIFTGLNLHQLQRLFRTAGDIDAEHRAKLVWRGMDAGMGGAVDKGDKAGDDEAELAQALVGLRVRARNKAGIRAGQRDHKGLRASGYVRTEGPLQDYTVEDEETALVPSRGEFLLLAGEDIPEKQNPIKPSSWRLGVERQDSARDPTECYLHLILH